MRRYFAFSEAACPVCGGKMHACGHEVVRRELRYVPAQYKVVEHVQTAYSCRNCEKNALATPMKKSEVPAGLIPGSGVGNHRMALNREGLGVPVVSVGIPTVVGVETAAKDLLSQAGGDEARIPELRGRGLFVTPDHIDVRIRELAKVVGYGLNLALQPDLEIEDLDALLA